MNSSDYNKYLDAIKKAKEIRDKDALERIKMQLIANYGLNDKDADYLVRQC